VTLEDLGVPLGQTCRHRMRGTKGKKRLGYLTVPLETWRKACPNRATGLVDGSWRCAAHGGPKR
jgi:imidazoleglycerol phosphate dehydratase HisB